MHYCARTVPATGVKAFRAFNPVGTALEYNVATLHRQGGKKLASRMQCRADGQDRCAPERGISRLGGPPQEVLPI